MSTHSKAANSSSKSTRAPATAAPQALGYSLQYTRLTLLLLESPVGTACSLEVLDDVESSSPDGQKHLVQSKSALGDNPVSDRAVSLWKSIFNWLQLIERALVDPRQTTFKLYVSREVHGEIVQSFHEARTSDQARAALAVARDKLSCKGPESPHRQTLPPDLARYVNVVLSASEELVLPLIVNMRLRCGSGSPQSDLLALLATHPISPPRLPRWRANSAVGSNARSIQGWSCRCLQLSSDLIFTVNIWATFRSADRDTILKSFAPKPTEAQKLAKMSEVFVRQLELVDADFDEKLEAVSDYLRACWDRTSWSKEGDVHEDSFKLLDEDLCRVWKNISGGENR